MAGKASARTRRVGEPRGATASRGAELWVASVGRIPYRDAIALQERLRARRLAGEISDALLLLEHPPIYTRGRRSSAADLPMGEPWYRSRGIEVSETNRGGRVTYHGPGQLVGYPIMAIGDVLRYVRTIERALLSALADEGIRAEVHEGLTGVWAGERKIGSIGVHVSRGITTHGFAINVDNDLQPFEWIVPCGIDGVRMTSIFEETQRSGAMNGFREHVASRFAEAFGLGGRPVTLERLTGEDDTAVTDAGRGEPAGSRRRVESVPA